MKTNSRRLSGQGSFALLLLSLSLVFGVEDLRASDQALVSEATPNLSELEELPDQGYRVHAGVGMGFGLLNDSTFVSTPTGSQFLGSLSLGRRTGRWEWDTSLGWGFSRRTGIDTEGFAVGIQIRSARADFNARYRLSDGWAIGPVAALHFGTDTRYTQLLGDSKATPYIGSRTTIDLPASGGFSMQVWGEALTEMSWPPRDAFTGMVGVRIGMPVSFDRSDSISVRQAAPEREVRVVLDGSKVFFATDSTEIKPAFKKQLRALSQYLNEAPDEWTSMEIEGHADIRGTLPYNVKLSQRRAEAVRRALASAGMSKERLFAAGYGPTRPVDLGTGSQPWARNRRVELIIRDVAQPDLLKSLLQPLTAEQLQISPKKASGQKPGKEQG